MCLAPYATGIGEPVPQPTSGYLCPCLAAVTLLHLLEIIYGQKPLEQLRPPGGPQGPDAGRLPPPPRAPTSMFRKANTLCTLASDPARRNPR